MSGNPARSRIFPRSISSPAPRKKSRRKSFPAFTNSLSLDEEGFVVSWGRNDDMLKVKGLWAAPTEIEASFTGRPAVREAAVVSFADHDGFTKPIAYVVLRQGHAQSEALIAELCAAVRPLGGYKVPERYEFIDELPRTTLMKIDRRAVRRRAQMLSCPPFIPNDHSPSHHSCK